MSKIDVAWHKKHKMPKSANGRTTEKERITWHIEHAKHCQCRQMPDSIKKLVGKVAVHKQGSYTKSNKIKNI